MLVAPRPEHAVPQQRTSTGALGAARLRLVGELDVATLARTEHRLEEVLRTGAREVVVDVSDVAFMDVRTLRLLLRADARLRARGGRLRLRAPSRQVRRLLAVTGCRRLADDGPAGVAEGRVGPP